MTPETLVMMALGWTFTIVIWAWLLDRIEPTRLWDRLVIVVLAGTTGFSLAVLICTVAERFSPLP